MKPFLLRRKWLFLYRSPRLRSDYFRFSFSFGLGVRAAPEAMLFSQPDKGVRAEPEIMLFSQPNKGVQAEPEAMLFSQPNKGVRAEPRTPSSPKFVEKETRQLFEDSDLGMYFALELKNNF